MDSGCTTSIASEQACPNEMYKRLPRPRKGIVANGEQFTMTEKTKEVQLLIEEKALLTEFLVMDDRKEDVVNVIIGNDILMAYQPVTLETHAITISVL